MSSWMLDVPYLGRVPQTRLPWDVTSTVSHVLPAILCYLVFAGLAIRPGTRVYRVALWPLVFILAARAATYVDYANGSPGQAFFNVDSTVSSLRTAVIRGTLKSSPSSSCFSR